MRRLGYIMSHSERIRKWKFAVRNPSKSWCVTRAVLTENTIRITCGGDVSVFHDGLFRMTVERITKKTTTDRHTECPVHRRDDDKTKTTA